MLHGLLNGEGKTLFDPINAGDLCLIKELRVAEAESMLSESPRVVGNDMSKCWGSSLTDNFHRQYANIITRYLKARSQNQMWQQNEIVH